MTTEQPTQDHQPQAAAPAFTLVPAPTQMVESFYPPTVAIPSTTKPEEINWLGPPLLSELEALPKPDRTSDTPPILENKFNEVFSAVATRREWYNIYQFFQFCMSAMVPWGYEVKLSNDHRFVHCLPNAEACAVSPYDIHFNFIKKTYQLSRARPECASNTSEKMEFYAQKRKAAAAASVGVNGVSSIAKKQRPEAPTKTLFDVQWNSIYERLKKYREKYGNCCVPTRGYEDPQLAKWVSRQREYHNKGTLSQERIDKLNALGFSWRLKDKDTGKGPTSDSTWEKNFNRLKAYREKFGDTHVPTRGFDDPQLAKWVSRQREYYQKRTLSQERINKLNSIGFTWQLKAGGPKKKRSGGTNDAKITTTPIAPKTSGSVEGQNSQDENQTTPAPAEVNKERAENEVAALLTNLRHTSSRS